MYEIYVYNERTKAYRFFVTAPNILTALKWLWYDCCDIPPYSYQINPFQDFPKAQLRRKSTGKVIAKFHYNVKREGYRPNSLLE